RHPPAWRRVDNCSPFARVPGPIPGAVQPTRGVLPGRGATNPRRADAPSSPTPVTIAGRRPTQSCADEVPRPAVGLWLRVLQGSIAWWPIPRPSLTPITPASTSTAVNRPAKVPPSFATAQRSGGPHERTRGGGPHARRTRRRAH